MAQAHEVRDRLAAAHGHAPERIEICPIKTSGDRIQDRPLAEAGGKGLFTKEIEEALLAGEIELAVHSMKDLETRLPAGLAIRAVLAREDARDAFISLKFRSLTELPAGAKVGTSSLRRQAQVRRLRPDLEIVDFRGNVETRLEKLERGLADATFLAVAGLKRLGKAARITRIMEIGEMLPAVAQGAIGIEIRADDEAAARLVEPLDHAPTALCVASERAFLARLDGSCRTPVAGHASLDAAGLTLRGELLSPDGRRSFSSRKSGPRDEGARIGEAVAEAVLELARKSKG
jgi:hydroxymethylbilane synthase